MGNSEKKYPRLHCENDICTRNRTNGHNKTSHYQIDGKGGGCWWVKSLFCVYQQVIFFKAEIMIECWQLRSSTFFSSWGWDSNSLREKDCRDWRSLEVFSPLFWSWLDVDDISGVKQCHFMDLIMLPLSLVGWLWTLYFCFVDEEFESVFFRISKLDFYKRQT